MAKQPNLRYTHHNPRDPLRPIAHYLTVSSKMLHCKETAYLNHSHSLSNELQMDTNDIKAATGSSNSPDSSDRDQNTQ